ALLKDKIVFIGADLIGLDRHETPLASWENDDEMPGVLIHAQVAAQLIDNRKIERVNGDILRFVYAFLATVGLWIGLRFGSAGYSLYFTTTTLIIAVIDIGLFVSLRQFLPFSACLAALAIGLVGGILMRRPLRWATTFSR
ncbi:MAG: CHASE2 domain-containing protein, partial [Pseudomonadota bacterium]